METVETVVTVVGCGIDVVIMPGLTQFRPLVTKVVTSAANI